MAQYDAVTFYIAPDADGSAFERFGADPYDVFLVDKRGRLAATWSGYYDDALTSTISRKIRQLHDE